MKQNFAKDIYPTRSEKRKLAEKLGLSESQVYNWFGLERMRVRRGKCPETLGIGELVGLQYT